MDIRLDTSNLNKELSEGILLLEKYGFISIKNTGFSINATS